MTTTTTEPAEDGQASDATEAPTPTPAASAPSVPAVSSVPSGYPDVVDLSGQGLERVGRATRECELNTTTLVLDGNNLQRLDNIHTYQCLEKVDPLTVVAKLSK